MTTETNSLRAKSPNPTPVQSEQNPIPDFAMPILAEREIDDQTFDKYFASAGEELVAELETGVRARFIRLMVERYISDDAVSDHSFSLALRQIQNAAEIVDSDISFAIDAAIQSHVNARPVTSLEVSVAQELRDMEW